MIYLPGAAILKNDNPKSTNNYHFPTSQPEVGSGLNSYRSYECCHKHWEFPCSFSLLCPCSHPPLLALAIFLPTISKTIWSLERKDRKYRHPIWGWIFNILLFSDPWPIGGWWLGSSLLSTTDRSFSGADREVHYSIEIIVEVEVCLILCPLAG